MLNEQEVKYVEVALEQISIIKIDLLNLRSEIDARIEQVKNLERQLTPLLPPEKRIDRLFH
jgi:hypothetical protein